MPFLHAGMYSLRNVAADDLVLDDDALAAFARPHIDFDVAVLTATAGLLDQLAYAVRAAGDRFAIGDLRLARVRVHLELAEHAVANDFEMQLAHAGDDRLAGVFVRVNAEGRIFFGETLQRDRPSFPDPALSSARSPLR